MSRVTKVIGSLIIASSLFTSYVQAQSKWALNVLKNNASLENVQWQKEVNEIDNTLITSIIDDNSKTSIDAITIEFYANGFRVSALNNTYNVETYKLNDSTLVELVSGKSVLKMFSPSSPLTNIERFTYKLDAQNGWFLEEYKPLKGKGNANKDTLNQHTPLFYGSNASPMFEMYERLIRDELKAVEEVFVLGVPYFIRAQEMSKFMSYKNHFEGRVILNMNDIPPSKDDKYILGESVFIDYVRDPLSQKKYIESFKVDLDMLKMYPLNGSYEVKARRK